MVWGHQPLLWGKSWALVTEEEDVCQQVAEGCQARPCAKRTNAGKTLANTWHASGAKDPLGAEV